jgi:hypothetical protein
MEIDLRRISGRPLRLGAGGWAVSLVTALAVAARMSGELVPILLMSRLLTRSASDHAAPMPLGP